MEVEQQLKNTFFQTKIKIYIFKNIVIFLIHVYD